MQKRKPIASEEEKDLTDGSDGEECHIDVERAEGQTKKKRKKSLPGLAPG